jgi:hypothetical protein
LSIRWVLGGATALLAALLVLPGIASAHHPEIDGESSCNNDGSWHVDFTVGNSESNSNAWTSFDNNNGFLNPDSGPFSEGRDMRVEDISATEGTVEDVAAGDIVQDGESASGLISDIPNEAANTELDVDAYWRYYNSGIEALAGAISGIAANALDNEVTAGRSETFDAPDFDPCKTSVCTDGQTGVESFIDFANPTGDCDPVRLCVDGQSMTVTEFTADTLDAEPGSCVPSEDPPAITTTSTEPEVEEEPVEEVEAVAAVSPAIEEVAALPAAGQGDVGGVTYTWIAVFGLALLGLGSATALTARSHR